MVQKDQSELRNIKTLNIETMSGAKELKKCKNKPNKDLKELVFRIGHLHGWCLHGLGI